MAQQDKISLNLAGEFAVASELNRRRVLASVTYGASKSADVFALSRDISRVVRIEVKTTDKRKWVIGSKGADRNAKSSTVFWVLVQLPAPLEAAPEDDGQRGAHSPRYFVLSAQELYTILKKHSDKYRAAYRSKHGREFRGPGVPHVTLDEVVEFEGKWHKIISQLNHPSA